LKYASYAAEGIRDEEDPSVKLYKFFDPSRTQNGENYKASNQADRDWQDEAFHGLIQSHFPIKHLSKTALLN
jgi:hypothetical protein